MGLYFEEILYLIDTSKKKHLIDVCVEIAKNNIKIFSNHANNNRVILLSQECSKLRHVRNLQDKKVERQISLQRHFPSLSNHLLKISSKRCFNSQSYYLACLKQRNKNTRKLKR